jgi:hypothetical protein
MTTPRPVAVARFLLSGLLACGGASAGLSAAPADESVPLFNGRDLSGFYVVIKDRGVVTEQEIFTVEDGLIHVYPSAADGSTQPFAGLITKAEHQNYHLTFEYKWGVGKFAPRAGVDTVRDAGVLYHVHDADVIWPSSVECQIQEGDTGDIWAINTRVTSTVQNVIRNFAPQGERVTRGEQPKGFARFHRSYSYEQPGWNKVELIVRGNNATYVINGHVANQALDIQRWDRASGTWRPLTGGKILLQAEGAEVFYRNVMIKPLSPE